jgi:hypothetical protein
VPAREERGVLGLERISHVVALDERRAVVQQQRHVRAALEIREAQRVLPRQNIRRHGRTGHDLFE